MFDEKIFDKYQTEMRRNDGYKSLIIRSVQKEKQFQETTARATNVEKSRLLLWNYYKYNAIYIKSALQHDLIKRQE